MFRLLKEVWLWIIVFSLIFILVGPFVVIFIIMQLPQQMKIVVVVFIIVGWGVAKGYKDWILYKRKKEKQNIIP